MADDLLFGGFRGPGGFMPAATTLTEPVTNAAGSDLLAGEVVRLNGNATVTRAQANAPANVVGLVGAMQAATPLGALGPVVSSGRGFVLLEPALVPVAGEALWVSATTPGRATNVAPPLLSVYLGIVKDASGYGATGGVIADLAPSYTLSVGLNTLHAAYAAGVLAADQTMKLTDADGGGVVVDGSAVAFTGANAFTITGTLTSSVVFPRTGGAVFTRNENNLFEVIARNTHGGVAADVGFTLQNETAATVRLGLYSSAHPALGALTGASTYWYSDAAAGIVIMASNGSGTIRFAAGGAGEVARILSFGVLVGTTVAYATSSLRVQATKTIAAPAAIDTWDGVSFISSTLTLTAGFVAPNELAFHRIAAPTITQTAGVAYVVPASATVIVDGPPAAGAGGGATPTLTNPHSVWIKSGYLVVGDNVGHPYGGATNSLTIASSTANCGFTIGQSAAAALQMVWLFGLPGSAAIATGGYSYALNINSSVLGLQNASGFNVLVGAAVDAPATLFNVLASKTVASAAGAVWNGIKFAADTLTITGGPGAITSISKFAVEGPTITSAAANVIGDFYTQRIGAAAFAGAGPASATRSYSLFSEGNTKFGGGMTFKGTDVNAAGPYVVLPTDFFLEVRYTATGAIQINMPSIATVGNGRVIAIIDSGYNAAGFNITVARNGADTINNVAGNYTMNVTGSCIWFKANATTNNWEIV
jgi:hypothetical protein